MIEYAKKYFLKSNFFIVEIVTQKQKKGKVKMAKSSYTIRKKSNGIKAKVKTILKTIYKNLFNFSGMLILKGILRLGKYFFITNFLSKISINNSMKEITYSTNANATNIKCPNPGEIVSFGCAT